MPTELSWLIHNGGTREIRSSIGLYVISSDKSITKTKFLLRVCLEVNCAIYVDVTPFNIKSLFLSFYVVLYAEHKMNA